MAKQMGVTTRTLDRWHTQRLGPPRIVIGRTILFKIDSALAWLAAKEQRR
jgi:DNA-binding transcriptional MerR regulator